MNSDLFDRKAYKSDALKRLKGNWKVPCVISLIIFAIEFFLNIGNVIQDALQSDVNVVSDIHNFSMQIQNNNLIKTNDWISFAISILSICISGIIAIACSKFYLRFSKWETVTYKDFIDALELWAKGILETLWMSLFIFLWSLLFVIPGIIKAISYSQAFFILADNPDVGIQDALKMSQKITKGYKTDIFVMYLSFIGWAILCCLTAGIGFIWLIPYFSTTKANAYKFLMQNAMDHNRVTYADLHKSTENI